MKQKTKSLLKIAAFVLLSNICSTNIFAQSPPVLPTGNDTYWFSSSGGSNPIQGLNTAVLDFGNINSPNSLCAAVYSDGSAGPTTLYIKDPTWGGNASIALNTQTLSTPDVIIGNWDGNISSCSTCTSPSTDFIVAVAYINGSGDVEIDYYDVYDDGINPISINSLANTTPFNGNGYTPQVVHIDVIAEWSGFGGFANCNKFVVAFDDYSGGNPDVHAGIGELNIQPTSITAQNITAAASTNGYAPDVAGVQKQVGMAIDNFALITYVGLGGNSLKYQDCDFDAGPAISGTTILDNGSSSNSISKPRIDGRDDYQTWSGSLANYKIVAEVINTNTEVRTYDDLMGGGSNWVSSGVIDLSSFTGYSSPPYDHYSPTVAFIWLQVYLVSHFMKYSGTTSSEGLMMEPIDNASSTALFNSNYYWTNNTRGGPTTPPPGIDGYNTYANAVSASQNYPAVSSLYTWSERHTGPVSYDVYYKYTSSAGGGNIFGFKNAPSKPIELSNGGKIYPNPATDHLVVAANMDKEIISYNITDVVGRVLKTGILHSSRTIIDINELNAGTYILQLYRNGNSYEQAIFLKN